jgi:hypothetical protein
MIISLIDSTDHKLVALQIITLNTRKTGQTLFEQIDTGETKILYFPKDFLINSAKTGQITFISEVMKI